MITYNQEQYVVEQLESIKYQILHYGKNYLSYFLLCDDASSDCTVDIVQDWLKGENIFEDIIISASSINQGIVKNFMTALKKTKTDLFKILGGDDLYYKNNIFKAAEQSDFIITPPLKLNGSVITNTVSWPLMRYILLKKHLKNNIKKDFKYLYVFETPGVFWNHKYADAGLYQELSKYTWCEDLICWDYLLNLQTIEVGLLEKPYIIYRINCGIYTNKSHEFNKELEEEAKEIHKKVFVNRYKYPECINPYRYIFKIRYLLYIFILRNFSKQIRAFEELLDTETEKAKLYYSEIHEQSQKWMSSHGYISKINKGEK